jgi:hypothetical protein
LVIHRKLKGLQFLHQGCDKKRKNSLRKTWRSRVLEEQGLLWGSYPWPWRRIRPITPGQHRSPPPRWRG